MLQQVLRPVFWVIFRLIFSVEYYGVEHVPDRGPVIIAGNHPSYLDPVLVGLPLRRQIKFMAWDALFRVPLLGLMIRALGAFPVDIGKGKGESAFREALRVLKEGEVLGIFPEGQRSESGPMGDLKLGVARLAVDTGAQVVPVTIGGAFRAWPKWKLFPKPAKIVVRFHPPLVLDEKERLERKTDREYHAAIMQTVAERINRSLLPALRGGSLIEQYYKQPPSSIRSYEWGPLIALIIALLVSIGRGTFASHWIGIAWPAAIYYLYLAADLTMIKPGRFSKWLRNSMPVWLILIWHYPLTRYTLLPTGSLNPLLTGAVLAAFFSFFYEDYFTLQKFVRGIVTGYYFSLLFELGWPDETGTFVTLLVFILVFVFWYKVIYRWLIGLAAVVVIAIGIWMTGKIGTPFLVYSALAVGVNAYLQTFTSIAYDIRRAGNVNTGVED